MAFAIWLCLVILVFIITWEEVYALIGRVPDVQGFVSFSVQSETQTNLLLKRDQDIQLNGTLEDVAYYIELFIGTPVQRVQLQLTTSVSDTWVIPNCTELDSTDAQWCNSYGTYDPQKSSSSEDLMYSNSITYVDQGTVTLSFYTDMITFTTGQPVSNITFGVAFKSGNEYSGFLGLGFGETTGNTNYTSFIDQLAAQSIIQSRAFSLALGNQTSGNEGVVIFGGVDTKKFAGNLVSNNIQPAPPSFDAGYYIQMIQLGLTSSNGVSTIYSNSPLKVLVTSGFTLSYLPTAIVNAIAQEFQATYVDGSSLYTVPCSQPQIGDAHLDFYFGDLVISVQGNDLIIPRGSQCILGVTNSSEYNILGLTFLRSTYAVFDQTLMTVSLAQYTDCGTHEQSMPSSGAAGFTGECVLGVANTSITATSSPSSTGTVSTIVSATVSSSSPSLTSTPVPVRAKLSSGAEAGIGVGISIGIIAGAGLLYFLCWRHRKRPANQAEPPSQDHVESAEKGQPTIIDQTVGNSAVVGRAELPAMEHLASQEIVLDALEHSPQTPKKGHRSSDRTERFSMDYLESQKKRHRGSGSQVMADLEASPTSKHQSSNSPRSPTPHITELE